MKITKVKSIKKIEQKEDVYDISVKDNHNFFANNLLVHNCQEYTAIAYSSCNLGSINTTKFVCWDKQGNAYFDWDAFKQCVRLSTRFLDSVIDINDFPIPRIEEITKQVRPIGLGLMGFAHTLYLLGIKFNSEAGYAFARELTSCLTLTGMDESCEMAKEKGAYPAYDEKTFFDANSRFFANGQNKELADKIRKYRIRNSCNSSLAPTGTISFIADTTGGIEPTFALTYARKIEKRNKQYEVVYITDPIFEKYLDKNYDQKTKMKILKQVADHKGSCQEVEEIPQEDRNIFVVAGDLTPMEHLTSLAACAPNISTSISKTVNMPSDATREEISEIYLKAHELGVIGVTVYRDNCREGILVHNIDTKGNEGIVKTNAPKRPKSLPCHVYRVNIFNKIKEVGEKWIIFIGLLNDEPYEIIAGKINGHDFDSSITEGDMIKTRKDGKKVYQFAHKGEVLCDDVCSQYLNELREYSTRLMSLALRHGAGIEHLQTVLRKSGTIVDFNQAIVRAVARYVKETTSKEKCPKCNSELRYVEGCVKCSNPDCSFSKCGS